MLRVARERRVHDDQVESLVGNLRDHLRRRLFPRAARPQGRVAGVEEHRLAGRLKQFKRADFDRPVGLPAILHCVDARLVVADIRLSARQRGAGDVNRGGHHVAAVEHILDHPAVQRGGIAAGALVLERDLVVDRREQRARPAGEIADPKRADRLCVGPVRNLQQRNRQPREQRSRGRARVEGRQILAVRDQALEDAAGEIVRVIDSCGVDLLRGAVQLGEDQRRFAGRQLLEDVARDREDGKVVDLENARPRRQRLALRIVDVGSADEMQRLHAVVHTCNPSVEHQRVGDNRAGHPPRLFDVIHSQQVRDAPHDSLLFLAQLVEHARRPVDAFLQRIRGAVHLALRRRNEAN